MARNSNGSELPELWGGLECTINRVGDIYRDQLALTGHYDRQDDLQQIAGLGLSKLRYPILWERYAPVRHQTIDFSFAAKGLEQLAADHIEPIAGLVHHGSGPAYTNLLDPDFPSYLAEYAFEVISRFPQLCDFTPVNEPLTTARFSGLYGLWYPHHSNDRSFALMLLNQLKAVVLSMQTIRTVNPLARLIQTEDLGKTHGTELLAEQVQFENNRRWLSFDILCGKFLPGHPLWSWFTETLRIPENDLWFFTENSCSPDLLGLNYYVTSERWLDEDLAAYPVSTHGGNHRQTYADTEIVRVHPERRHGLGRLARESWERYNIPLAFTEVHLHCTREEQMRWWMESWQAALTLRRQHIPVMGVTAWSLLGAYDWDSLLTTAAGHYEPGVFVVEDDTLRQTGLGMCVSASRTPASEKHPLLAVKGWWRGAQIALNPQNNTHLLVVGPDGIVAETLRRACLIRGITCRHQHSLPGHGDSPRSAAWAVLQYSREECLLFFTDRLFILSDDDMRLAQAADQVLDLVIDGATGSWSTQAGGLPVRMTTDLSPLVNICEDHFQNR